MNKKPFIVVIAVVLGIILTNLLVPQKHDLASDPLVEDRIETSQASAIPL